MALRLDKEKTAVFCYGSNSTKQLRERVRNDDLKSYGCSLPQYRRIFCGYSHRWRGGCASIVPLDSGSPEVCFGTVVFLSLEELARLDRFEGIHEGNDPFDSDPLVNVYRQERIHIILQENHEKIPAIAYVKNDQHWEAYPSDIYLEACYSNISPFWPEVDGNKKLKVFDVNGNLQGEYLPERYRIEP